MVYSIYIYRKKKKKKKSYIERERERGIKQGRKWELPAN